MKAWLRWTFDPATVAVTLSGAAYGGMKYLMHTDDPFAVVNHPWQPTMLHVHVLAAPMMLVGFGALLSTHVARRVRTGDPANRLTGLVTTVAIIVMAASGYVLQVMTDERWRGALVWAHVLAGVPFSIAYLTHLVVGRRLPHALESNGDGGGGA